MRYKYTARVEIELERERGESVEEKRSSVDKETTDQGGRAVCLSS